MAQSLNYLKNIIFLNKIYELRDRARIAIEFGLNFWAQPADSFLLRVTEADMKRAIIAMRVMLPSSMRDAVALFPVIYGRSWSYGKIQGILAEAEKRADEFSKKVDHAAIENLNSVLRPYLVVQKDAQQGFLNLFRYYWNMRKRGWGSGKGTSVYEVLTSHHADDWLTLLGYPPSEQFEALAA